MTEILKRHENNYLFAFCLFLLFIQHVDCKITNTPQDTEVIVGGKAIINCKSNETLHTRWRHSRVGESEFRLINYIQTILIPYSERFSLGIACNNGQFALTIREIQKDDAGEYCCTDRDGRGEQMCVQLIVLESVPRCINSGQLDDVVGSNNCNISPDRIVEHKCSVPYFGKQPPQLIWKLDKREVMAEPHTSSLVGNTVTNRIITTVSDQSLMDAPMCQTLISRSSCRSVYRQQYVLEETRSVKVSGGTIQCTAIANVFCTYAWYGAENNELVVRGPTLDLAVLDIYPGKFECIAECLIKNISCSVKPMHIIYTSPTSPTGSPKAIVTIAVIGLPILSIALVIICAVTAVCLFRGNKRFRSWLKKQLSEQTTVCEKIEETDSNSTLMDEKISQVTIST